MDEAHGGHFAGHLAKQKYMIISNVMCGESRCSQPLSRLPSVCK